MAARRKPKAGRGGRDLSQYGLMSVGGADMAGLADDGELDVSDAALEDELAQLLSGAEIQAPRRPKPKTAVPADQLAAMTAACMKDDDEISDVDENDPDLLAELMAVSGDDAAPAPSPVTSPARAAPPPPVPKRAAPPAPGPAPAAAPAPAPAAAPAPASDMATLLLERLEMYRVAEANAKEAGQTSRARRFGRGLKTLEDLLKRARAGRAIDEEDIPPPVYTAAAHSTPAATAPAQSPPAAPAGEQADAPPPAENAPSPSKAPRPDEPAPSPSVHPRLGEVQDRMGQYKHAAVLAKKAGDKETALQYVRVVKAFEQVIAAMEAGETVDLSDMPPPPPSAAPAAAEGSSSSGGRPPLRRRSTRGGIPLDEPLVVPEGGPPPADPSLYNAPPPPATVLDALQQRLERYKQEETEAKESGSGSKARRYGRICKQYTDAIRRHQAGKPVAFDELPTPPGFGPIPTEGAGAASPVPAAPPAPAAAAAAAAAEKPSPAGAKPGVTRQKSIGQQTRQQKQRAFLDHRRKLFLQAALQAKKDGDKAAALEYLRSAKGFEPLLEATENGLPVNMDTLPIPPQERAKATTADFEVVSREEAMDASATGDDAELAELFQKLEADLVRQATVCQTNRDHYQSLGEVAEANKFDRLAQNCLKDLDALRHAYRRGDFVPKFHYETREFQIVKACTDLNSNDLELTIVRGVNYNVSNPKDVDTYVKWEFPWPQEAPTYDKTGKVKNTNNPEYDAKFMIAIDRSSRSMMRIFRRQSIKCEVWERGHLFGWTDQLIGTAQVKLEDLQDKCVVHKAYNIVEGRRTVKGKLEVKMRMRKPAVSDQVEQIKEKWLVIDKL
ncbi:coiled-coil and C2 domain-containing protein 1-like isoform X2 [Amphibalanus amphitrite]|uniref:coiled-coil and C2 domain-containing protein 1-like isoform X2 n=1 Tax=Amphibalanus amphitrite TaxID=1232801 RepID=UPI001C91F37A|nr:coiled-coil and C2 domain-containing protein 1-like isoform X2 [Amphibalanus amphitrite]